MSQPRRQSRPIRENGSPPRCVERSFVCTRLSCGQSLPGVLCTDASSRGTLQELPGLLRRVSPVTCPGTVSRAALAWTNANRRCSAHRPGGIGSIENPGAETATFGGPSNALVQRRPAHMKQLPRTFAVTVVVMACLVIAGCRSSSTEITAPTTSKCQVAATSSLSTVPAAGGSGTVAIDTTRDCTWSASTAASWITFASSTSGQGSGTLAFGVGANPAPAVRQSAVSINDILLPIDQAAAPCTFGLSLSNPTMSAAGGAVAVQVVTINGCAWITSSSTPWLTVTGGGNAPGQATITVAANAGPARVGTVTIAGQAVTVSQAASPPCAFSVSPTSQTVSAAGGSVSVQVNTSNGCAWTTSSSSPWLMVAGGGNASGLATISAAANAGAARMGTVTIAGQAVTVSQAAAAPCTFRIAPTSQTVPAAGGTITIAVTAGTTCSWTSTTTATWITIATGAAGTGNGSVTLTIAVNTGAQRTATVTIAGQAFTASQAAAAACSYSIAPTTQSMPAQGGSVSVHVTTTSDCAWTAAAGAPWITVTGSGAGHGDGTVNIAVAANTGSARNGTVTIAGETFTITQAAPPCSFITLAPTSHTFSSAAGGGTVTVTTQAGCTWSASTSNPDWLSITAGKTGTGNGTVTYAVTANTQNKTRTGQLTIGERTFDVTQNGRE